MQSRARCGNTPPRNECSAHPKEQTSITILIVKNILIVKIILIVKNIIIVIVIVIVDCHCHRQNVGDIISTDRQNDLNHPQHAPLIKLRVLQQGR